MRNVTRPILTVGLLFVLYLGATAQAQADPVIFNLTNPIQTVTAGTRVTFIATITNPNTEAFLINGRGVSGGGPGGILSVVGGSGVLLPPDSPFPTYPISFPALTTLSGSYLDLVIPLNATPGTYTGNMQLGVLFADGSFQIPPPVNISVTIIPPGEVPEPTSMLLFGTGLLGSAGALRWRRKRVKSSVE